MTGTNKGEEKGKNEDEKKGKQTAPRCRRRRPRVRKTKVQTVIKMPLTFSNPTIITKATTTATAAEDSWRTVITSIAKTEKKNMLTSGTCHFR